MHIIDLLIVVVFLLGLLAVGFAFSHKAGKSTAEFILGGRRMPWWLVGTSVAAAGLNASTMLQDTRKIRQDGLGGGWFRWRGLFTGALSLWFLPLWRRGAFTTQMEFYHARYSGWKPSFLRVFDSVLFGMLIAGVWAAEGLVGMKKIVLVLTDLPPEFLLFGIVCDTAVAVVLGTVLIALVYSAASGVYGVVWTDFIEFLIAVGCAYFLMVLVLSEVGWFTGLRFSLDGLGAEGHALIRLIPPFGPWLIAYFFVIMPILEQGGYNPHIQRTLCLKDEREVFYMSIYASTVNLVLRSVPYWVLGLASVFLISDLQLLERFPALTSTSGMAIPDFEKVFPILIKEYLPVGLLGLMIAGLLSAFMSSFDSNIHNSASIFLNDLYRRFLNRDQSERHYLQVVRVYMGFITAVAATIGILVNDILLLFMFAITISASVGIVKALRFVWWRTNGTAEVVASVVGLASALVYVSPLGNSFARAAAAALGLAGNNDAFFIIRHFGTVSFSSIAAIAAILCTSPEPMDKLKEFVVRVRPFGCWGPVYQALEADGIVLKRDNPHVLAMASVSYVCAVGGLLMAVLNVCLTEWDWAAASAGVSAAGYLGYFRAVQLLRLQEASCSVSQGSAI